MDIHKRFVLSAIASAILALHAEVASAVSCPAQISGTALAGIICTFDSTTGSSVTVQNGGVAGGITMNTYNPASPSFININAGGSISATTSSAISVISSTLSNGLSNSGTISNTAGVGITIGTSTISGGVTNNGLITTYLGGIGIFDSLISGGILNSGKIVTTVTGTGMLIASSNISGGVTNSGTIAGSNADSGVSIINAATINGGFNNSGSITAVNGNGILMRSNSGINGGISNSGSIGSATESGISIINLSTINGNFVNNGTINGGLDAVSIHNDSSVNGSILNNSMISGGQNGLSIFSATTVSGSISNSGTIRGAATGIAILTTATINGGISNSGTIQGGTNAINISNSIVNNIDILGQHARVIGAVNAVNTTFNITSGAAFTSEGTFNVNNFNISSNAKFNMANMITAATGVNNSGTLAVGEARQSIAGNYTQNTGGIFQTGVSNTTNYGQLSVSGTADLSHSGKINVQVSQNSTLHPGDVLTNVINANTLIASTNGYQVTDNSFIWKFTAIPNLANTGLNLITSINPVAAACQGDYCQGAANVIIKQVTAGNPAFGAYATLPTVSAFQAAASQAAPVLINGNIQVTQLVTRSVMDVVPMWGTLQGKSAGDAMLSEPGKAWLKPYGGTIIQDASGSVAGYDATTYGLVFGKDIPLAGDWLLGGAVALGKENMRGKAQLSGQTISSDLYQALVYAARKLPHNVYLAGQGLLGYGRNNTSRFIPLYTSTAQGAFNSWFTNLRAQTGWNVYALNQNLVLTPELDASYLYVNQNSYRETGSIMALSIASNSNSSLVIGAYGNGAYHLTSINKMEYLTLTAYAGIARNIFNSQPQTSATFLAGGPGFTTYGVQLNNTVFRGGVGLNIANPTKPLRVNVNYDAQTGGNAYSGIGSVTISYIF